MTPAEPECTYNQPGEVVEGPKKKMKRMERRIAELEAMLAKCTCGQKPAETFTDALSSPLGSQGPQTASSGFSPMADPLSLNIPAFAQDFAVGQTNLLGATTSAIDSIPLLFGTSNDTSTTSQLSRSIWPSNLPPPDLLHHLVESWLSWAPFADRIVNRAVFLIALNEGPSSPNFPHAALLHAICATGSLYTPIVTDSQGNVSLGNSSFMFPDPLFGNSLFGGGNETSSINDSTFGALQLRSCLIAFRAASQRGERLLQLMQAAVLCSCYSYRIGDAVSTLAWANDACRLALPLGLTSSSGYESLSRLPPDMLVMPIEHSTPADNEFAINAFWIALSLERIYSAGVVWPMSISDEDCSQVMPCRVADIVAGRHVPTVARQYLFTKDLFTNHPLMTTDAFTIYVKGALLLGKVKTFNIRFKMRHQGGQNRFNTGDPRATPEFQALDDVVRNFILTIPKRFKDPIDVDQGNKVDPMLYMAHLLPHVAMILLHDPHATVGSPNCVSSERMLNAARAILDLVYKLSATTYDLLLLDLTCSFCWFVAGATLIQFLKVMTNIGNVLEVARLSEEVEAIRYMLGRLGDRALVGMRQLKLLEDMFSVEIGGLLGGQFGTTTARLDVVQ